MMAWALFILLCALAVFAGATDSFDRYEAALQAVCDHLVDVYRQGLPTEPCHDSTDGCAQNIKSLLSESCDANYGREDNCGCSGRRISRRIAVTRIAPGSSYSDSEVTKDVCLSRNLQQVYNEQMDANPGILKMYTGFFTGLHRTYPATDWMQKSTTEDTCRRAVDTCPPYDPRIRAWFVAAAVGPKDLILVLDVSGSMAQHGRITLLKSAAVAVIKTLTNLDYLGIVAFSGNAQTWHSNLRPADTVNRAEAERFVQGLVPGGGTDFAVAFDATFGLMRAATVGASSGCKTAILFLTDGHSDKSPLGLIENFRETEPNMFIFSHTLGNEADHSLPKEIACSNKGVYNHIADGGDLSAAMTAYWRVFAGGRGVSESDTKNRVFWSEPYEDFLGLGLTISPGLKCQADNRLLAVASLSVNKIRDDSIFNESGVNSRTPACPYFTISDEELSAIRGNSCDIDSAPPALPVGTATLLVLLTRLASLVEGP